MLAIRGGARHFHLGGSLEGPVLQQGELSMVFVGLSERDLLQCHDVTRKILGGLLGGPGKILGGSGPSGAPLAPPLLAICASFGPSSLIASSGGLITTAQTNPYLFIPFSNCTYNSHIIKNGNFLA